MVDTFTVEDMTVHRIVERVAPFLPVLEMFPALSAETIEQNRDLIDLDADDNVVLAYQSYVVRTPHHIVLVDSCLGNDKVRDRPEAHRKSDDRFLDELASAGLGVADIDYVMCTHLHWDHVGWNTRLDNGRWVPTFPRARYVFTRAETEATDELHRANFLPAYADSVLPILEAGQADLVDDEFHVGDHARLLPTPGHTDGHAAFCFGKGRDAVVMTGDLLHVPLQLRHPELSFARDRDPVRAATTRRDFLERYCDTETLCCTGHLPAASVGRVRRSGEGFRLIRG